MLGPIDYVVVGFVGNNFDGSILAEIAKAAESGVIRVVDLMFIIKDDEGNVQFAEIEDQEDDLKDIAKKLAFDGELPLLTEEDVKKLSVSMDNNTSAGVLVIEHLWAKGLKKALIDAGGVLIADGRIHDDVVTAAVQELEESKDKK